MEIKEIVLSENLKFYYCSIAKNISEILENNSFPHAVIEKIDNTTSLKRKSEIITTNFIFKNIFPHDELIYTEKGAPKVKSGASQISISHSSTLIGMLVSKKICGLDIEESDRDLNKIAHRFVPELSFMCLPNESLLASWTAKEALFKAYRGENIDIFKSIKIEKIKNMEIICKVNNRDIHTVKIINLKNTTIAYVEI